ncbi:zinc finger X-linked protein ZXDB [Trichonephila clavata]|uniref:Zinc finger X-linked protein ZXDB n=1 Tax=Trichonephila clavata TaxID=2740835 RepID=A0A8X6M396_TRICU|nr:zinc finger X-linked protein ZXDB [Trichonephila clavata]
MENPAHVYTTGIPMSQKGNFLHNKYGCDDGGTLNETSLAKVVDHDYPNNSHVILCDSTSENVDYINSIQDGFQQSEILCGFVCDAGLQSDDLPLENSSMEVGSIQDSDNNIKFPDSPGASFSCKIETFSAIEGLVQGFDEQIDNYLLSDFQKVKTESEDGSHSLEEEQRTVTEAISAIAKSFGLEDLLPENFQVDENKDLPNGVTDGNLCGDENNIGDISLGDFEKCAALHSPGSSLDLGEQLPDGTHGFELVNGLEMLTSPSHHSNRSLDDGISGKYDSLKESNKFFVNSKDDFDFKEDINPLVSNDPNISFEDTLIKVPNDNMNLQSAFKLESSDSNCVSQINDLCEINEELVCGIPTVSITDVETIDSSEVNQNCSSAGAVLITRDKGSKKMQIVLTLDQGQQIYDIETESVDANEQSLDLDLQHTIAENQFQDDVEHAVELNDGDSQELMEYSVENESDKSNDYVEDEEAVSFIPSTFVELVSDVPVIVNKSRKGKTWVCPIESCSQILDKECKLRVHMISHKSDSRPFKCDFEGCDWAFTTPYRLRRHAETHLGSKDFICDFEGCNRKFTTVYNLKTHKKRHRWPNSLACPSKDCKLIFDNRRKLELHLRVHKEVEAPYKCSLCGKQYYSANCIASHYRTHQYNEDDFKCPFKGCGKVYDKICRLRQHIRHHTGERPYSCPAEGCKWSFMSASKLTRHMRKHTGERKFTCTEPGCGKSFMRPEHLKGHVVIHSGDKPFHCPHENCNAKFTAKSSLYVHVKKHCPSVLKVVYPCPITACLKKYNSKATLKQHLQKFHPEEIGEGKELNIAEKLELTMPVSLVNQNSENSSGYLELDDGIADDPTDLQLQFFQSADSLMQEEDSFPTSNNDSQAVKTNSFTNKTVPKSSKNKAQNQMTFNLNGPETSKALRTSEKLIQENRSGCARTDFCCTRSTNPKKSEQTINFVSLNQNSSDNQDTKSFLSSSQMSTEIKSPDIMLTSSIFHDQSSEHLLKSNFLHDECSSSHSLYHDDSILATSSAFEAELIPVSLLSDSVESDESVLNHSSGVVFSEQNSVDPFAESIHLLD